MLDAQTTVCRSRSAPRWDKSELCPLPPSGKRHRIASTASASLYDPIPSGRMPERDPLYSEFTPLVRRLIRQYGQDPAMREDLQGEIYYRFCILLDQYDPARGVPLRAYIVRQLTASIYIFARQHWVRNGREVFLEREIDCQLPTRIEDPTPHWDAALAHRQIKTKLHDAIRLLPERQRQVIKWRYYEERSFEEIGMLLNVQTATARSLLRHAMNNLRKRISPQDRLCFE